MVLQWKLPDKRIVIEEKEKNAIEGYGRKKGDKTLTLEEGLFLLERGKITIIDEENRKISIKSFFKRALEVSPKFLIRYVVYKDLKERGYYVMPMATDTEIDFLLYSRGTKPGEKPAKYFIRVLSEREGFIFDDLLELLRLARNMRKEPIIAVVDEESDITYYEIKGVKFKRRDKGKEADKKEKEGGSATLLRDRVILWDIDLSEKFYNQSFYGILTKEKRLQLSLVEAAYLMNKGCLDIEAKGEYMSIENFFEHIKSGEGESDFLDKYAIYRDLRDNGLLVKMGFKFGSHFRIYEKRGDNHSKYLVHVISKKHIFALPELSRAVRLAHSVRKKMIFAYREEKQKGKGKGEEGEKGSIKYVSIGRVKL